MLLDRMLCKERPGLLLISWICLLAPRVQPAAVEPDQERILHGKPLSNKVHDHEANDVDYDHEAFLGQEAEEFDHLSPDESRRRLGIIVDWIDTDKDGQVTIPELQQWIKYSQKRYIGEDVERQWSQHNPDNRDTIAWTAYRQSVYGFLDSEAEPEDDGSFSYRDMEVRDNRRWILADSDKDGELTKVEFQAFLHPEGADHMRDIVVTETLEDIDKDKDGKVNIEEYIGDMYRGEKGDSEPDWVLTEREHFTKFRDRNGDGLMDLDEVKAWIVPPDFDHSEAEAKHLVFEADQDQDNQLTKEEILDKYDLFVGSQATDFGEALNRHDEF